MRAACRVWQSLSPPCPCQLGCITALPGLSTNLGASGHDAATWRPLHAHSRHLSGGVAGTPIPKTSKSSHLRWVVSCGVASLGCLGVVAFLGRTENHAAQRQPQQQPDTQQQQDPLLQLEEELLNPDMDTIEAPKSDTVTITEKKGLEGPWITDPELQAALPRRAIAENRLRGYLYLRQREVQAWLDQAQAMGRMNKEEFEKEMITVEEEVNTQTNTILYNLSDPNARRDYLAQFGCSKWSEKALKVVASYGPLIEMGAGLGHWEKQLRERKVNIIAVDNNSQLPVPNVRIFEPEFIGKVETGDEKVISQHPNRTLLMVYPGPTTMAADALKLYKGSILLYVGETLGGVNANPEFFEMLEKDWQCVRVEPVEPFAEGFERLYVMQRKNSAKKGWFW